MTSYIPSLTLPYQLFQNPVASVLFPIAAGSAVGYFTAPKNTQDQYMALKQPPFRPAPWVFGPAWTLLYGLMGYAAHRAVNTGLSPLQSPNIIQATKHGATLYTLQLGLNFLWMPLFFGIKNPFAATADILALGGTVGYLTYLWGQVDSVAGWCLAPYLGWLGYATYLTLGVCHLNNWNLKDKTVNAPPSTKPGGPTKFVDEKSI